MSEIELEGKTVAAAAHDGALRYLDLLELAPQIFAAAEPDELRELRGAASQIGISLIAVGRRFDLTAAGSLEERQLLRDLAESLILLSVVSSVQEIEIFLLATADEVRSAAAACAIVL